MGFKMTTATDRYAVFGHPIKHSKSPQIHTLFAAQTAQQLCYEAIDVPPEQFTQTLQTFFTEGGRGLNCTVPLKELAWKQMDQLSDGIGLVTDLTVNHAIPLQDQRILILGAGGATRGILGPILEQSPQSITIANRTPAKAEQLAQEFSAIGAIRACGLTDLPGQTFNLIINATSASLSGDLPPLPDNLLADQGYCYDLAYANDATPFVTWGRQHHALKSVDGLGMLVEQAAEAFFIWRKIRPDSKPVIDLLDANRK
jgi:shikimate dehydrogenase